MGYTEAAVRPPYALFLGIDRVGIDIIEFMKPRGFTLIELIVVISVLAMLLALLLPALRGAREQSRAILCQTHIRQLLLAFEQYCQSEDGFLPYHLNFMRTPLPAGGFVGDATRDPLGWWWFNYLDVVNRTDLRGSGLLVCPSRQLDGNILARTLLWGNYGVNEALCVRTQLTVPGIPNRDRPVSINDIRRPAETLLILDSGYAVASWLLASDDPPTKFNGLTSGTPYIPGLSINKDRELESGVITDAIRGRHPGKTVNIGFSDGHIERKKADDLLVTKTVEGIYINRSPLWEPHSVSAP